MLMIFPDWMSYTSNQCTENFALTNQDKMIDWLPWPLSPFCSPATMKPPALAKSLPLSKKHCRWRIPRKVVAAGAAAANFSGFLEIHAQTPAPPLLKPKVLNRLSSMGLVRITWSVSAATTSRLLERAFLKTIDLFSNSRRRSKCSCQNAFFAAKQPKTVFCLFCAFLPFTC